MSIERENRENAPGTTFTPEHDETSAKFPHTEIDMQSRPEHPPLSIPPVQTDHHVTEDQMNQKRPVTNSPWQNVHRWFLANTFTPTWLPKRWNHPAIGYVAAVLLQIVAVFATLLLFQIFSTFAFAGLLEILAIVLVALSWGAGASLLATLVGVVLVNFIVLPPHFVWNFDNIANAVEAFLFLMVGFAITVVASQVERARRNAEELASSLATERTRLDAIIETVPDSVAIFDAQGTIVRLNSIGRQNAGPGRGSETLAEAPGAYETRTMTGDLLPVEEMPVARALGGETVAGIEFSYRHADGNIRSVSASAAPLHDSEGKLDGVVLITHDITALRASQREVVARASELEATFEAMADAVFVFGGEGGVVTMNPAARALFALDATPEYYARPLDERGYFSAVYDEHRQKLPEEQWPFMRVLKGEVFTSANAMDIIVEKPDGQRLELSVSGAPVYNTKGQIAGAVCVCRDVTVRRQLEQRTHEALDALLIMAETLVLIPTADDSSTGEFDATEIGEHTHTGVSKVAQRLAELTCSVLGCSRVSITAVEPQTEALQAVAVVGLSPEQERQWWAEQQQQQGVRLGDNPFPELVARLRANEVLEIDMTQPPWNEQPNPYGVRTVLIVPMLIGNQLIGLLSLDHSGAEHHYSLQETALARAIARLAALVIERERLMRERAEARSRELALLDANRRMDDFLSIASHELKTPLTSMKGNVELIVRRLKKSIRTEAANIEGGTQVLVGAWELIERTDRQMNRLARLVNDLLDTSRIQANKLELTLEVCDLTTLVREAAQEQRQLAANRTIRLEMEEEKIVPVLADCDRIRQVVTNYLTNALKYSLDDRAVDVRLEVDEETARILVRDQGPGIPPADQEHVWERFYRVPGIEVQTGSAVGLGLGLHICRTIIERHNGEYGVESTPGEGSTFWFTLPLTK